MIVCFALFAVLIAEKGKGGGRLPKDRSEFKELVSYSGVIVVDGRGVHGDPGFVVLGGADAVLNLLRRASQNLQFSNSQEIQELRERNLTLQDQLAVQGARAQNLELRLAAIREKQGLPCGIGEQVDVWWRGRWWRAIVTAHLRRDLYVLRDPQGFWQSWAASQDCVRSVQQTHTS